MDEQQARQRLLEGGYFVALGVPPGVDFGIDVKSYQTGPQFKGVKMIPAGLHFAHYGTGEGEKQGFFFRSAAGTVAATQWDASAEDLVDAQACLPHGALQALREAVLRLEMDANLGPYPFEQRAAWLNLTNCVSDSVLQRCGVPIGAKVLAGSSEAEAGEPGGLAGVDKDSSGGPKSGKMRAGSGMEIVPHFPHIGRVARFCEVPGREILTASRDVADAGAAPPVDPREVTKRIMDGSEALQQLIASNFGGEWMELLGEFQLSFVLFVSLSSLRGFRHWQALSALLCRCGDALSEHPTLFTAFILMLHAHLKLVPEDFFDVELSKDNFLVSCLSALVQNVLPDESLAPTLRDAAKRLLKFLQQRFGIFLGGNSTTPMSTSPQIVVGPKERSSHPDSAFLHDGMDEESVEVLEEAGDNGGLGSVESLNLLQLELSEEDQPTVVPYEEVARALGSDAFDSATPPSAMHQRKQRGGGLAGAGSTPGMQAADHIMGELSSPAASAALNTSREATGVEEGKKNTTALPLSAPSAEHSRRWQDIDRLLSAAATPPQLSTPPHHAQQPQPVELPVSTVNIGGAGATPAAAAATAAGGYAAAAATRYPLLFASTGANEDVMMAAARLVSSEDGEGAGGGAGAAVQAMAFLEEVGASEDGGAAIWQLSAGLPGRRNAAEGGTISSN